MRGSDGICDPSAMAPMPFQNLSAHNDDHAYLLNRSLTINGPTATEGTVANAQSGFLYWFPPAWNPGKTPGAGTLITSFSQLQNDFQNMVGGVGVFGCGIESQLESWYRFLIQPDPYADISGSGKWEGVDTMILQQRQAFLRPNSLVAIVDLTDENDSEIDVRSLNGQGYLWMQRGFDPPHGTSACGDVHGLNGNPADPACVSCKQSPNAATDDNCATPYSAVNDWGYDPNLRHVHMKAKYGVDPQYPLFRYVNGLTSPIVPDRNGEYPSGAQNYTGQNDCTNPLFAASLPSGSVLDPAHLCKLTPGTRTKDLIFYAHIGGVPWQLLHFTPGDTKASALIDSDWIKILGKGLAHFNPTTPIDAAKNNPYDTTGTDPHLLESYKPRPGLPLPSAGNNADAISGREWTTDNAMAPNTDVSRVDLEYACTFPLATPRDCTMPENADFCSCPSTAGLTADQLPPVCDPMTQTQQIAAKAYPTIRELALAHFLGTQGIISSICPQHITEQGPGDPLFGYRPAVAAITDRLKNALNNQCLPQALVRDPKNLCQVPCSILATLPPNGSGTCSNPGAACDPAKGLTLPPQDVLNKFCAAQEDAFNSAGKIGVDPATQPVCEFQQLTQQNAGATNAKFDQTGTCQASVALGGSAGWCYVTGAAARACPQAILFTAGAPENLNIQCTPAALSVGDAAASDTSAASCP
jgi:hypothetical protein